MKIKLFPLVMASLAVVAGCSSLSTAPPLGQVDLAADRNSYESGQQIVAHLSNDASRPISFSWCEMAIERLEIEGWADYPLPPRACSLALNVLEPGHQDDSPLVLESPLPPATYRLLLGVRDNFEEVGVVRSAPFEVTVD